MNEQRQITVLQASAITISTIVGVGVLALPLSAVKAADAGAPFVTFWECCWRLSDFSS